MIGCMIILMILAYSFMRTRYLLFVTLMTPYILILLYILTPMHFKNLIVDRIIDTAIGSGIALLANILFSPEWAYKQFGEYLQQMLEANKNYFSDVTSFFAETAVPVNKYKLSRKITYVALANLTDALNRMLAEPKSKQKNAAEFHELVVLNYMMSTHIATLATFGLGKNPPPPDPEYLPVVHAVISNLNQVMDQLKTANNNISFPLDESLAGSAKKNNPESGETKELPAENENRMDNVETEPSPAREGLNKMNDRIAEMVEIRRKEVGQGITNSHLRTSLAVVKSINDQFNFIWKISEDLLKSLRA